MRTFKFFLIFGIFLIFFENSYSKIDNNILVKVGNKIITKFELKNKILSSLVLSDQIIDQKNIDKIKKQSLELLIQKKIKENELDKYKFKNDLSRINKYLNAISLNDIDGLKKKFKDNNIDFNLFLEEVEIQFRWQQLILNNFSNKIEINNENLNQEINMIISKKQNILQFRLSEIEIPINNDITDEKKLSDLKNMIDNIGFENAALKFSISSSAENKGDLGWISSTSFSKKVFEIVRNLKIDEISEPIPRQGSATILKLVDKRQSNVKDIDLDQLRKNLINSKRNELLGLYSQSLLTKLRNTTLIEYLNE